MVDAESLQLLAVSPEWASFWVLILYTAITFGLLITSVLAEPIRNKRWARKLSINLNDPSGFLTKWGNGSLTRYFHLVVRNKWPSMPARAVRVECTSFTKTEHSGKAHTRPLPFPLQLQWKIPQSHERYPNIAFEDHCDLGHHDKGAESFQFDFYELPNNLDTSIRACGRNVDAEGRFLQILRFDGAGTLTVGEVSDSFTTVHLSSPCGNVGAVAFLLPLSFLGWMDLCGRGLFRSPGNLGRV